MKIRRSEKENGKMRTQKEWLSTAFLSVDKKSEESKAWRTE
jgi:hypothetical protein